MKVIVNADDFGLTQGGNKAIIESYKNGILTSTTLMATTEFTQEAIELAKENPGLGVGVHMVLTTQKPMLEGHSNIADENGNFIWKINTIDESIDTDEVYREWDAQIASIAQHLDITHLDSHHHAHLHPALDGVVQKLSEKYKVPFRSNRTLLPYEVNCDAGFYKEKVTEDYILNLFENKEYEVVDLMTHPAYIDDYLKSISSYVDPRYDELKLLSDPKLKEKARDMGIELISYRDIA